MNKIETDNIKVCNICQTEIELFEADEKRGAIWTCEYCRKWFCEACFEEKHGAEAMREMIREAHLFTGETTSFCPSCYGSVFARIKNRELKDPFAETNRRIEVKTVFGTLYAEKSGDPSYPGIYLGLEHENGGEPADKVLALAECTPDLPVKGGNTIRLLVWGNNTVLDNNQDDYTDSFVFLEERPDFGKDYRYEIFGKTGELLDDGYVSLDAAVEYALENDGYSVKQMWYPLDELGYVDCDDNKLIASEVVWERPLPSQREKGFENDV